VAVDRVAVALIGDGTNRVNIEQGLRRLYPQAALVKVDETASTVDAWRLKRSEEAGSNPFLQFWLPWAVVQACPRGRLRARVLAERYSAAGLRQTRGQLIGPAAVRYGGLACCRRLWFEERRKFGSANGGADTRGARFPGKASYFL
jgi:hypothetical protein